MIRHKAKLVLAMLCTSSALILTACGDKGPECGDQNVKDTVIAIVRDPKEFLGFLVRSEYIANTGAIGEIFLGQWYGKISKDYANPSFRADAVEVKFSSISEVERKREQRTVFCEAQLAVKIKHPEPTDLGTVHLQYKIQPNLADAGDYTVHVRYP